MPSAVQNALPAGSNQVTLKWVNNALCPCNIPFANYEVQVLRLYNRDVSLTTEQNISATIDWSQALSIETGSPAQELTLTLAEGTGFYAWRVRAISDFSPGGIADARNWWPWSPNHPTQNSTSLLQRTSAFGTMGTLWESNAFAYRVFYYEQFDKGRNWSFSRVFTEPDPDGANGVRIGERMSFATDLQQVQQEQVHQSVGDVLLATQTVMDFQGRPALQSLPTPVANKSSLGYENQLLPGTIGNYDATDFDAAGTLDDNTQISTGSTTYYLTNADLQIPSAERLPFSRTTFLPDGTGRVRQVSAPGAEFSFTTGHKPRTARTYYGAVSEQELTSIFGHEAYDRRSVQKMLTVDPNGVTSVTYQDKEGKTLATCLVKTSTLPLEDDERKQMGLLSEQYADEQETYDLTGGTATDPYTVDVSADSIIPADDTEVEIMYTITPSQVQDCADYCSTCDYSITYYLRNTECPTENLIPLLLQNDELPDPMAFPPPGCNGSPTELTLLTTTVQLDMGSYQVGRIIQVNNLVNGTNTPSIPAQTMLQGHLQLLEAQYNTEFDAQLAGLVTDLESNDLDAFYDDPLVVDMGNGQVAIPLGCDTIRLPKLECPPCVIDADTLLHYFISVYNEAFDPDITTDLNNLPTNFWSDFFSYPESGALTNNTYSQATFADLDRTHYVRPTRKFNARTTALPVRNIWGCWIGAVHGYVAYLEGQSAILVSGIPGASTLPLVGGAPPAIPDQHLMDMFIGCAQRSSQRTLFRRPTLATPTHIWTQTGATRASATSARHT
ncbi:MAG: hypothetical protein IPN85_08490 [Flavobacteriales bacterium]|nr:hypothetical protein [Flavobacteriales bacterium]